MKRLTFFSSALLLAFTQAQANIKGGCEEHTFPLLEDKKTINTTQPLRVLRQNAPVYSRARGNQIKTKLKFGEPLDALTLSNSSKRGRVEVNRIGAENSLGWMDRSDLLCRINPLQNDKDLDRKAFIKTQPRAIQIDGKRVQAPKSIVPAYPHDQSNTCHGGGCKELSYFEKYFIYAESNKRYLLAKDFSLLTPKPLIGWVDKDKVIPWNTTLQIRPHEDVRHISAFPEGSSTNRGVELTGGNIWYKFPQHLPLLEIVDNGRYYLVAVPGIGMRGITDAPEMVEKMNALEALFKRVDVFFLLDGTRSMEPSLNAAKKFVTEVMDTLANKPAYRKTHFRFGFRVYRDDYAGNRGIGEGLPFSGSCENKKHISQQNQEAFQRQIEQVYPFGRSTDRTFEENLFIGLRQAVRDMANCPDHLKMLFVIGDHGDNEAFVPRDLNQRITQTFTTLPVTFFVQTPNTHPYKSAYQRA